MAGSAADLHRGQRRRGPGPPALEAAGRTEGPGGSLDRGPYGGDPRRWASERYASLRAYRVRLPAWGHVRGPDRSGRSPREPDGGSPGHVPRRFRRTPGGPLRRRGSRGWPDVECRRTYRGTPGSPGRRGSPRGDRVTDGCRGRRRSDVDTGSGHVEGAWRSPGWSAVRGRKGRRDPGRRGTSRRPAERTQRAGRDPSRHNLGTPGRRLRQGREGLLRRGPPGSRDRPEAGSQADSRHSHGDRPGPQAGRGTDHYPGPEGDDPGPETDQHTRTTRNIRRIQRRK